MTDRDKDPITMQDDIDAEEARRIILARRARYVALALAATGFATQACGGDSATNTSGTGGDGGGNGQETGGMTACLSVAIGGTGIGLGGMTACLQPPFGGAGGTTISAGGSGDVVSGSGGSPGAGGMTVCLSPPLLGGMGGTHLTTGGSGGMQTGGMTVCLSPPPPGGMEEMGGMTPCLSPPELFGGSAGLDEEAAASGAPAAGSGSAGRSG